MQQGHAAWTFSMGKQHRDMDMEHGHEAKKCSIDMQKGHAKWTCMMDEELGQTALTCNIDMLHGYAASTCDAACPMLHLHAACSCYLITLLFYATGPSCMSILMSLYHTHAAFPCRVFFSLQKSANVLFVHYFSGLVEVGLLTSANANLLTTYILQFLLFY
jgi:hypothetical protein